MAACSTCYGSREQATIASYEREFGVPDGVPLPEPPEDLEEE